MKKIIILAAAFVLMASGVWAEDQQIDANGDGTINMDQRAAFRQRLLNRFDGNNDGRLDRNERRQARRHFDRAEDRWDRREDQFDRREDRWDRREDRWDRREDVRDRREDRWDRREDVRDRREDVWDRRDDKRKAHRLSNLEERLANTDDPRQKSALKDASPVCKRISAEIKPRIAGTAGKTVGIAGKINSIERKTAGIAGKIAGTGARTCVIGVRTAGIVEKTCANLKETAISVEPMRHAMGAGPVVVRVSVCSQVSMTETKCGLKRDTIRTIKHRI